ncbi:MAG TPA: response regulator transcription factor [Bacteroidia bacterium]|jgi:DNA-binding NarL/FixJ family response regulator|nr:response regulator transcription factor [Bacteroidia bacterium]
MKKILVTDDHPAIRDGVKQIINRNFSDVVFGEASNGAEAFRMMNEKDWDLLILDLDMPGRSGLEVLKQLRDEGKKLRVLIFSMHAEEQIAIRVFKLGADGYLSKDSSETEMIKAIETLLNGRKYISAAIASALVDQLGNPDDKLPHELLSEREYQTMLLIASGKTVSGVAEELSLSVTTVSTYRARILEKLSLKSTAEIVNYVYKNNLQ